jgi:hypothetical protein
LSPRMVGTPSERAERAALAVAVGGLGRHVRRRAPAVYRLCR